MQVSRLTLSWQRHQPLAQAYVYDKVAQQT